MELVNWIIAAKKSLATKNSNNARFATTYLQECLDILKRTDLKQNPDSYIHEISDKLETITPYVNAIDPGFKVGNLTLENVVEKLSFKKGDRNNELKHDLASSDSIEQDVSLRNAEYSDARKVITPDKMRIQIAEIQAGIAQNDDDKIMYHLFSFNESLKRLMPFAKSTEETDQIDDIFKMYPELEKTDKLKNNLVNLLKKAKVIDIHMPMIRYLTMKTPIEAVLKKVDGLFPKDDDEQKNTFKQKLYKYQTEHAREIYDKQINLGSNKIQQTPSNDEIGSKVAYHFLISIRETIMTTDWNVGFFGRTKAKVTVSDMQENKKTSTNTVTPAMKQMLEVIAKAYKKDPKGETEIWKNAFSMVAKMGTVAANRKQISIFGKRSEATQEFYDRFTTAYTKKDEYEKTLPPSPTKKKKN